jgi:hypothetical protein
LVTFFLQKQKKVTSCRATPGSVRNFYAYLLNHHMLCAKTYAKLI